MKGSLADITVATSVVFLQAVKVGDIGTERKYPQSPAPVSEGCIKLCTATESHALNKIEFVP